MIHDCHNRHKIRLNGELVPKIYPRWHDELEHHRRNFWHALIFEAMMPVARIVRGRSVNGLPKKIPLAQLGPQWHSAKIVNGNTLFNE
jgi:hypothetical protein